MTKLEIIKAIREYRGCTLSLAADLLDDYIKNKDTFICTIVGKDQPYNATLTFITEDSYKVMAKEKDDN